MTKQQRYRARHPDRIKAATAAYRARNLPPTGPNRKLDVPRSRREQYARLRRNGLSIQQAAWQLQVNKRTAERYERSNRDG
jgi:hypothetical protein